MKRYVCGFMFSEDRQRVLLIQKLKPEWQRGKLNGIGGKIEPGETPIDAMVREFREETGLQTAPEDWREFVHYENPGVYEVHFFRGFGADVEQARTLCPDEGEIVLCGVLPLPPNVINNLRWLIPMALDPCLDWSQSARIVEAIMEPTP